MTPRNKIIITGALVALLASVPIVLQQREIRRLQSRVATEDQSVPAIRNSAQLHATPPNTSPTDNTPIERRTFSAEDPNVVKLTEELEAAQTELDQLSRPFTEPIFSSVVKAELGMDEVLVLGGFPLENGNYLFTFVSPEPGLESDGRDLINISSRLMEFSPDAVAEVGLDGLATNVKNTLQHAEAWKKDDYQTTLRRLEEIPGVDVLLHPTVRLESGHDVTMSAGTFSVALTIANRETEPGYHLTTRLEIADTFPSGEEQITP